MPWQGFTAIPSTKTAAPHVMTQGQFLPWGGLWSGAPSLENVRGFWSQPVSSLTLSIPFSFHFKYLESSLCTKLGRRYKYNARSAPLWGSTWFSKGYKKNNEEECLRQNKALNSQGGPRRESLPSGGIGDFFVEKVILKTCLEKRSLALPKTHLNLQCEDSRRAGFYMSHPTISKESPSQNYREREKEGKREGMFCYPKTSDLFFPNPPFPYTIMVFTHLLSNWPFILFILFPSTRPLQHFGI